MQYVGLPLSLLSAVLWWVVPNTVMDMCLVMETTLSVMVVLLFFLSSPDSYTHQRLILLTSREKQVSDIRGQHLEEGSDLTVNLSLCAAERKSKSKRVCTVNVAVCECVYWSCQSTVRRLSAQLLLSLSLCLSV